ncbi:MAG: hypothetical protein HY064_12990 [Bacteroidetes bacterium]|nr:hypothetical protein [Bacteroidota bacterium]
MKTILSTLLVFFCGAASAQLTKYYSSTATYDQVIARYKTFDLKSNMCLLKEAGTTDIGKPLHLFIISKDQTFDPVVAKQKKKAVLMINNGIHPGEPDGIDASMELTDYFIQHPDSLPSNIILLIIPVYNVDGCLDRGSTSRANQNGPDEYGFRGNAKNLDLNRDFIKCDAENTRSLEKIFQQWKPDVFVDTHVSDGADYQYTMTLIATSAKLHPAIGSYMENDMTPFLYAQMHALKNDMCPYVNEVGNFPDEKGISAFLETPRFSTGYTGLFNCIGYVTETHMLKNYNSRVIATYDLLKIFVKKVSVDAQKIIAAHQKADLETSKQKSFGLNLVLDTNTFSDLEFHGFEAKMRLSDFSNGQVMYYDEQSPFAKNIKYYKSFSPLVMIDVPVYYVIPQAWKEVIDRLKWNGVKMKKLKKDTTITVNCYYIGDMKTGKNPYESHYLHSGVQIALDTQQVKYYKGDYVIRADQNSNAYLVTVLEPQCDDSYFCWNFFDGILQQKEWFSDYVWEEKADSLLKTDPVLKKKFDDKMKDPSFAGEHWAQLNLIYQNSPYKEKTHDRYPVTRINSEMKLPVE